MIQVMNDGWEVVTALATAGAAIGTAIAAGVAAYAARQSRGAAVAATKAADATVVAADAARDEADLLREQMEHDRLRESTSELLVYVEVETHVTAMGDGKGPVFGRPYNSLSRKYRLVVENPGPGTVYGVTPSVGHATRITNDETEIELINQLIVDRNTLAPRSMRPGARIVADLQDRPRLGWPSVIVEVRWTDGRPAMQREVVALTDPVASR